MKKKTTIVPIMLLAIVVVVLTVWYIDSHHTQGATKERIVLTIDQIAVEESEFQLYLNQERALTSHYFKEKYNVNDSPTFWTTAIQGEIPIERARTNALEKLKQIKVQQRMAKEVGLLSDLSYGTFLEKLTEENARRLEAIGKKQAIYGPKQYDEAGYYQYVFTNMVIELKTKLAEKEWLIPESELRTAYEAQKEQRYKKPDTVLVARIVMPFSLDTANATHVLKADAKKQMDEIKRRIDQGESFEQISGELAKDSSKWITGEQRFDEQYYRNWDESTPYPEMVKEVSKVPIGMTSEILEMNPPSFGMFKVIDRKQGAYAAFDEVKDNVRQMIIDDKYETKVNEAIQVAKVNINREVYADTLFR